MGRDLLRCGIVVREDVELGVVSGRACIGSSVWLGLFKREYDGRACPIAPRVTELAFLKRQFVDDELTFTIH